MRTAKEMWRTQMAEIILVEKPNENWGVKERVVFHLNLPYINYRDPKALATVIYDTDSEHTVAMIADACRELAVQGILATKTEKLNVSYLIHPDMRQVIENIRSKTVLH